ncbi:glycosyltransferase [Candidatus Woesearchaeota archaeon]|nr:glycosyltransferase [Candidatus Woesearchaeota archaeon]
MIKIKDIFTKRKKLISLIMPVYNNEKYIEEAIQSVMNQTYSNWELIIVDDGSTDKSGELAKSYTEKDDRIRFHKSEINLGIPKTRNIALRLSKGEYIGHIDSDDKLDENALLNFTNIINKIKSDLIYSNFFICDKDMKILSKHNSIEPSRKNLKKSPKWSHLVLYNRKIAIKLGGFNENHDTCTDCELLLNFAQKRKKINKLNKETYYYRLHDYNSSKKIRIGCKDCNQIEKCNVPNIMGKL